MTIVELSMNRLWSFWSAQVGWWILMIDGHRINEQINRFYSEMGQCWLHLVYSSFSEESSYGIHTSHSPNWITMFSNRFPPQKYSRLILLFSYCYCCCHCCLIAIYLSQKFHIWPVTYEMGIYVYCQLNCRSQSYCVASCSQLNKKNCYYDLISLLFVRKMWTNLHYKHVGVRTARAHQMLEFFHFAKITAVKWI